MFVQNKDNQKGWYLVRSVSPNSLLKTFFYRTAIFFYRCFLLPVLTMSGKTQKHKNTKTQNIIYNIQTISRMGFVRLCRTIAFLCKRVKKGVFWGGVFALKCRQKPQNPPHCGGFLCFFALLYVMLNLFNVVQFAHVDFVFLPLTRHSMQASSALVSFIGSA